MNIVVIITNHREPTSILKIESQRTDQDQALELAELGTDRTCRHWPLATTSFSPLFLLFTLSRAILRRHQHFQLFESISSLLSRGYWSP